MIRDVSVVLRGTIAAQAIGLMLLPVLARVFPPTAFGHYSIYQAAIMVVTGFACLRYDMAILTAQTQEEAFGLFRLSVLIALGMAICVGLILVPCELLGATLSAWLGFSVFWFAPGIALVGFLLAATALLTRLAHFRISARTKIAQAASAAGASLALGAVLPTPTGLVIGDLIGRAAGCGLFAVQMRGTLATTWRTHSRAGHLMMLARKFDGFPRFSVAGGLLNNGASFLAPAAMLSIYGAEVAGQFSLVDRAISLPVGMIVVTLSQVFTSHFGRILRENPEGLLSYYHKVVLISAGLAIVPALVGAALGPTLFGFVFGAKWETAGYFARILTPMYFSAIAFGPVSSGLVILNRLRWQFCWEAVRLLLLTVVWVAVATLRFAPESALALWGGTTVVVNFVYLGMVEAVIRRRSRETE